MYLKSFSVRIKGASNARIVAITNGTVDEVIVLLRENGRFLMGDILIVKTPIVLPRKLCKLMFYTGTTPASSNACFDSSPQYTNSEH